MQFFLVEYFNILVLILVNVCPFAESKMQRASEGYEIKISGIEARLLHANLPDERRTEDDGRRE